MKKKDFESQLRKGLEGYEVAPPDDLWQRIEGKIPADSQLLSQKEKARKGAIVPLRRWVAVAAATLLVVGGVGLLLHQHSETTTARVEKNGHFVGVQKEGTAETTSPTNETEMNIMPTAVGMHSFARVPYIYSRREDHTIMADSRPVPLETYAEETQKPTLVEVETADSLPAFGPPDVHTITVKTEPKQYEQPSNPVHNVGFEMPDDDARLLATVHFGSMSGGANTTVSPVYMSDEMYSNFAGAYEYSNTATRMANNVELTGYEENREYQLPLKYGLSVSYRMTDRWAIQTGANYMQQRTKLTQRMKGNSLVTKYNYEYIGVPVGASYKLMDVGSWLSLYATAGVEADFNFKARADVEQISKDIPKDSPQFSVVAAMGAQLNLPMRFGIYVEPGVTYFFDNGSNADTRMKDQPLNASLQVGLRYSIK